MKSNIYRATLASATLAFQNRYCCMDACVNRELFTSRAKTAKLSSGSVRSTFCLRGGYLEWNQLPLECISSRDLHFRPCLCLNLG